MLMPVDWVRGVMSLPSGENLPLHWCSGSIQHTTKVEVLTKPANRQAELCTSAFCSFVVNLNCLSARMQSSKWDQIFLYPLPEASKLGGGLEGIGGGWFISTLTSLRVRGPSSGTTGLIGYTTSSSKSSSWLPMLETFVKSLELDGFLTCLDPLASASPPLRVSSESVGLFASGVEVAWGSTTA